MLIYLQECTDNILSIKDENNNYVRLKDNFDDYGTNEDLKFKISLEK